MAKSIKTSISLVAGKKSYWQESGKWHFSFISNGRLAFIAKQNAFHLVLFSHLKGSLKMKWISHVLVLLLLACLLTGCRHGLEYNEKQLCNTFHQHEAAFHEIAELLLEIDDIQNNQVNISAFPLPEIPNPDYYIEMYDGCIAHKENGVYFYTTIELSDTKYQELSNAFQSLYSDVNLSAIWADQNGIGFGLREDGEKVCFPLIVYSYRAILKSELDHLATDLVELGGNWYAYVTMY